jgi:hypothetical protein
VSDNLNIQVNLAPVAVRLPSGAAENQVITNQGPVTVFLEGVANNVITAVGSSTVVTPGIPFPPGSKLRLIRNGANVFANTVAQGVSIASPPAVPATGVNATNTTGGPVAVTIVGGTVTQVAVNGATILAGTSLAGSVVAVPAGGTINVTYSAAPTWTWKTGLPTNLVLQAGVENT